MICIFGEDESDTLALKHIIRKLRNDQSIPIKTKNFNSCGDMLSTGHRIMKLYHDEGCTSFVISYDSDGQKPIERQKEAYNRIVKASGLNVPSVILVPVEEIEAWILADNKAVQSVIKTWQPVEILHPETVSDPKEHLESITRGANRKARYYHASHNPIVAQHLDLSIVHKKCPSFRPLKDFITELFATPEPAVT